jgi:hypothetical protein
LLHKDGFWTSPFLFVITFEISLCSAKYKITGHEVRLCFNVISHLIGFKWLSVHQMQRKADDVYTAVFENIKHFYIVKYNSTSEAMHVSELRICSI